MADIPASRRRIPEERTQLPVTTNDLVAGGAKTLRQLDTKTIGAVIDKIGGMTPQTRQHLTDALHKLAQIADTLQQSGPQLKTLVTSSNKLLTTVKSRDAQLVRLGHGSRVLLDQLRERQAELTVLLGSGSRTVTRISDLIDKQQQGLVNLMTDLGGTVSSISAQQDDMNNLLAWLGPSMSAFADVGSYGPFIDAIATQIGPLTVADLAKLAAQKRAGK
jgi:phospholipid/cholesterol/gamma-HCH transport system substrate-binding protein